jgi:hypothetical protein
MNCKECMHPHETLISCPICGCREYYETLEDY